MFATGKHSRLLDGGGGHNAKWFNLKFKYCYAMRKKIAEKSRRFK